MRPISLSLALVAMAQAAHGACALDRLDLRDGTASARFTVEVADDPVERSQGLMFVEDLGRFEGMLFVYPAPQRAVFWMKNTPLPLDILFADEAGVVQRIHRRATPYSLEGIDGGPNVRYVLEINGGMAELLGLEEGTELRHPAIESAAWPCE